MTVSPASTALSARGPRRDIAYQHNLGVVATLVHHHRVITRAQLTTLTGLNRSTVGSLVAQLEEIGLVEEGDAVSDNTVGRPSPTVTPRHDVVAVAVIPDLDAITLTVVGLGSQVHSSVRVDLDHAPTAASTIDCVLEQLSTSLKACLEARHLVGVSFAVPGLVRADDATVTMAPHLGWKDEPLGAMATEALSYPVRVGNDATLAMVAEATFGAARAHDDVIYLNGSVSGIGGGAMVGGVPLRGADGYAGELGHTLVASDGRACHCGRRGCLETEVNGQLLANAMGNIATRDLLDRIPDLNDNAAQELDRQADILGHGIANMISVFNPRVVVLGGYLAALFDARTARVRQAVVADSFTPLADQVVIEHASLGPHVVAVGAAELAFADVLRTPASMLA